MPAATAATATPIITISTTPLVGSGVPSVRRSTAGSPLVGLVARIVAGIMGALLGLAVGLVSAGFDTTRLLLALGAVALVLGWSIALVTGSTAVSPDRR